MELSRRAVLKGSVGAVVAVTAPIRLLASPAWAAAPFSQERFASQVGTVFRFATPAGSTDLRLLEVASGPAASTKKASCFFVQFDGGTTALPQGTYPVSQKSLGTFALFVVPGLRGPVATFNTL